MLFLPKQKALNRLLKSITSGKDLAQQDVLKDVSLKLFNGENLVVLGKSGSGKSVLIKCIVRLLDPDDGTINVLGEDVSTLNQ